MRTLVLAAASTVLSGSIAIGQTSRVSATLAEPLPTNKELVANSNAWRCQGSSCLLVSTPNDPFSVRSCHELARLTGTITAYGTESRQLDADKLAKCNAKS